MHIFGSRECNKETKPKLADLLGNLKILRSDMETKAFRQNRKNVENPNACGPAKAGTPSGRCNILKGQ